ncbi:MAG: VOC family protein [Candidatus Eremiobacteraeota bacterium]|nr:VOC family protein [Candidatus Eremiobacteraeota bacterium]MBC5827477.1 VOC family protein [Candidatus Eremiobacteraeota bacterium]
MSATTRPTLANGKICYIEIPATSVQRSTEFYERVFGWQIRRRDDGSVAFDDTVNEVSGTFVLGRTAASQTGLTVHIMVADAAATSDAIVKAGGEIVQPADPNAPVTYALFRDPGGNVLGIYQQPGLAE